MSSTCIHFFLHFILYGFWWHFLYKAVCFPKKQSLRILQTALVRGVDPLFRWGGLPGFYFYLRPNLQPVHISRTLQFLDTANTKYATVERFIRLVIIVIIVTIRREGESSPSSESPPDLSLLLWYFPGLCLGHKWRSDTQSACEEASKEWASKSNSADHRSTNYVSRSSISVMTGWSNSWITSGLMQAYQRVVVYPDPAVTLNFLGSPFT